MARSSKCCCCRAGQSSSNPSFLVADFTVPRSGQQELNSCPHSRPQARLVSLTRSFPTVRARLQERRLRRRRALSVRQCRFSWRHHHHVRQRGLTCCNNTGRAPGGSTKRVQYGHSGAPYALKQEALEGVVPFELMQEAQCRAWYQLGERRGAEDAEHHWSAPGESTGRYRRPPPAATAQATRPPWRAMLSGRRWPPAIRSTISRPRRTPYAARLVGAPIPS